ncbi:MAG: DEAD/DEAH box helicase [Anaerolineae bacterium]|nr:DEAD/DEAH box helicase [Anaerolineae bacterium]
MQFQDLKLIEPLLRAVRAEGYTTPTPIQTQAIPHVLAGKDLIGCAQTGTGKTAAFALPILQRLAAQNRPANGGRNGARPVTRVLVLSPTRELSSQINDSFNAYGRYTGLKSIVVFGGVGQQPQVDAWRRGADVLVATPGRLLDLMNQGIIRLDTIEIFVLDEADRMLDMGFIHDVRKIIAALPVKRQTLLFSATMPQDIQDLADRILINPVRVEVTPQATTVEKIAQSVFFVNKQDKRALLEHLLDDQAIRRVLVFTRTKHGANKLAQQLERSSIQAEAIHGNKSQSARERALANFKSGKTRVLVATDIAARGIDVDDVTHVINFDLPNEPESYVHRIGRTARAGASGIAYSFCDAEEQAYLRDIEKLIRLRVPVVTEHPYATRLSAAAPQPQPNNRQSNGRGANTQRSGGQVSSRQSGSPQRSGGQAANGRGGSPQRSGAQTSTSFEGGARRSSRSRRRWSGERHPNAE